jgi:Holliday junction resolvase
MANPTKQKGTGGEREFKRLLESYGLDVDRMPASAKFDLRVNGSTGRRILCLATRPDRGKWLVTLTGDDFAHLLAEHGDRAFVEVKRWAAFPHHTLWQNEMT